MFSVNQGALRDLCALLFAGVLVHQPTPVGEAWALNKENNPHPEEPENQRDPIHESVALSSWRKPSVALGRLFGSMSRR